MSIGILMQSMLASYAAASSGAGVIEQSDCRG